MPRNVYIKMFFVLFVEVTKGKGKSIISSKEVIAQTFHGIPERPKYTDMKKSLRHVIKLPFNNMYNMFLVKLHISMCTHTC